jgi:hypothetical protein
MHLFTSFLVGRLTVTFNYKADCLQRESNVLKSWQKG